MLYKQSFTYIDFNHVYRNNNKRADELSNLAITTNTSQQIEFKSELTVDTDVNVNVLPDIIDMNEDWNQERIKHYIKYLAKQKISCILSPVEPVYLPNSNWPAQDIRPSVGLKKSNKINFYERITS